MLMDLSMVRDFLKTLEPKFSSYYVGKLDAKKDNSLGIYNLKRSGGPQIALGGLDATKTLIKKISLLIHGTKNNVETEKLSNALYESLLKTNVDVIGTYDVCMIGLLCDGPINVGNDDNGVCEYVIEFEIYYQYQKKED